MESINARLEKLETIVEELMRRAGVDDIDVQHAELIEELEETHGEAEAGGIVGKIRA